jgi:hypothetical protein
MTVIDQIRLIGYSTLCVSLNFLNIMLPSEAPVSIHNKSDMPRKKVTYNTNSFH